MIEDVACEEGFDTAGLVDGEKISRKNHGGGLFEG